ncbi:MAG: DEAD/DEAH box helicase, partial [Kiritimatiellia bacterium]
MFEGNIFGKLDQQLQHAITDAGYKVPTPIQEQAMPYLLDGRDLIGCAQTGTGKTAAFMLPILNHLVKVRKPRHIGHPRALVLSPTRELAAQTAENVKKYSKYVNLPFACVFGGVSQFGQVKDIKKGAETVIACPGRLIDLMTQGILFLDQVECFVLDEADRMLDMGFLPDIKRIISKLPKARQSLFFSATMSPQIRNLAGELVRDPAMVTISPETPTVEKINQKVMFVEKSQKDALLIHLLKTHPEWTKVIVFTKMRHGADRVNKKLFREHIPGAAIHSDKTQNQRTRALEGFRKGEVRVLVATDIASRGIDVPDVSCVVNMELPLETESYVHRIGRTARAGESGAAISLVSGDERTQLKAIERFIKKTIPVDRDHPLHDEFAEKKTGKQN